MHQWAAALESLDKLPNLLRMFNPSGYLTVHGATGYAAAGSFFAFLDDRFGRESLFTFYSEGEFEKAYGFPLSEGISRWKKMLRDEIPLSDGVVEEARYRLDRKPVL